MSSATMSTEEKSDAIRIEHVNAQEGTVTGGKTTQGETAEVASPLKLGWRTWLVVFLSSFTIMAQVYTTVAAASVVSFIAADFDDSTLSGWIIQGPLLMQAALSPIVGRLSDTLDRKWLASIPPLIAFIGAVICAKATSMNMLIGGGILIGVTLSTISIVQSIPSEILPLKYRAVSNGICFLGGASAGIIGQLSAGAYADLSPSGWRYIFWTQASFHLLSALGFLTLYWPPPRRQRLPSLRALIWACDPIGSLLFIPSIALILLGLDWAGSIHPWSSPHVLAPLVLGCVLLLCFCLYESLARPDGLAPHAILRSPNYPLALTAFTIEGHLFYSVVTATTPQMPLRLGWSPSPRTISLRQLSYLVPVFLASIPITAYATRFRDMRSPLLFCFGVFLAAAGAYAATAPDWGAVQLGLNAVVGVGQAGPLTLLVAVVQWAAVGEKGGKLGAATGLAFSARAVGGAVGNGIVEAVVGGYVGRKYEGEVRGAAERVGWGGEETERVVRVMAGGVGGTGVREVEGVVGRGREGAVEVVSAGRWVWARAYRRAWASVVPFVVVAVVCVWFLRGVEELMTEEVEATVERAPRTREEGDVEGECT